MNRGRLSRESLPYLFVGPAFLVMFLVVLYPFAYNLYISTTNMNLYHLRDPSFLGLDHYRTIFQEPKLYTVFVKTFLWTVVNLFFHVTIGVALAILLNQNIRGRSVFRSLLILPWAMPQYIRYAMGFPRLLISVAILSSRRPWSSHPPRSPLQKLKAGRAGTSAMKSRSTLTISVGCQASSTSNLSRTKFTAPASSYRPA